MRSSKKTEPAHGKESAALQRLFTRKLFRWFAVHKRAMPWRATTDVYKIFISEVMLQQTQVLRVEEKFPTFVKAYPTVWKLASASKADVIKSWKGMGYNSRAIRLRECAQIIAHHYKGKFPVTEEELITLPGVGKYTANALRCFALKQNVAVVDVNVVRVFSRFFFPMNNVLQMKTEKEIWQFAETILPEKRAYEWNQALMDFGATICTARQPHCRTCVLKQKCSSGSALLCNEGKAEKIISREKKYYGYPVRYYRGKIVEMLRTEKKYISPEWIAGQLFSKITNKKIHFVQQLADALEKDGLLRKKKIHTTRRYHLAVQ